MNTQELLQVIKTLKETGFSHIDLIMKGLIFYYLT